MVRYDVKPEIEAFDFSRIFRPSKLQAEGKIAALPYVQFALSVRNAMPIGGVAFDFYLPMVKQLSGEAAQWCAAGIGQHLVTLYEWAIAAGGHARKGLENYVLLDNDRFGAVERGAGNVHCRNLRGRRSPRSYPDRSGRIAGPAAHRLLRAYVQPGRQPCAAF